MGLKPYSEKEASAARCVPAGTYDFEVIDAHEKVSHRGNDMIELTLSLWVNENRVRLLDWLLDDPRFAYKVRHFADTCNILDEYEQGGLASQICIGRCGRVQIRIENSEQYGIQNRVKDYGEAKKREPLKPHPDAVGKPNANKVVRNEDDIPF